MLLVAVFELFCSDVVEDVVSRKTLGLILRLSLVHEWEFACLCDSMSCCRPPWLFLSVFACACVCFNMP